MKFLNFTFYPVIGVLILSVFIYCDSLRQPQNHNNSLLPNLIVFIADDVSWDDLGCYGNDQVQTPNIDALAQDGMVFKNTYLTTSSCSPSRNSIITGRYPHNTGGAE